MISHRNMIENCEACSRAVPITPDDTLLSFLPLSHSRAHGRLLHARAVRWRDDLLRRECRPATRKSQEVRPTLMTGVPQVRKGVLASPPLACSVPSGEGY